MLAALSLATDQGNGQPFETALRITLLALALGRDAGVGDADLETTYWAGVMRFVGCLSTSVEEAWFGGDDLDNRAVLLAADFGDPRDIVPRIVRGIGRTRKGTTRARAALDFMVRGPSIAPGVTTAHCEVAVRFAERLGLGEDARRSLDQYHESWDGKGPRGLRGDAATISARLLKVSQIAVALGANASEGVARRAGRQLDPNLARRFVRNASELERAANAGSAWERFLAAEPKSERRPRGEIARVFADYVDLKSPYTLGHSSGVAKLSAATASALGLDAAGVALVHDAACVHDLGRASVPNGIWDKPGALGRAEWERVRLHAYFTDRILAHAGSLAPLAKIASSAHERLDGGGYHRASAASDITLPARILAAADRFHAMTEDRAHRPALGRASAARILSDDAKRGEIDARVADAVIAAAGEAPPRRKGGWPNGLSDREVEVLALVTRGLSNKEIGVALAISARTVQHHTIHVYAKIGVASRAAAALFALENGLFQSSSL